MSTNAANFSPWLHSWPLSLIPILTSGALLSPNLAHAACYQDADKFTGNSVHWCAMGGLGQGETLGGWSNNGLEPIPTAVVHADGSASLGVRVLWKGADWLFMNPGTKLIFLTDTGQKITLVTATGSQRTDVSVVQGYGTLVREEAVFAVDRGTFEALAGAKKLEFAVYGREGRMEGSLGPKQIKYYRDLLDKVLPATKAP